MIRRGTRIIKNIFFDKLKNTFVVIRDNFDFEYYTMTKENILYVDGEKFKTIIKEFIEFLVNLIVTKMQSKNQTDFSIDDIRREVKTKIKENISIDETKFKTLDDKDILRVVIDNELILNKLYEFAKEKGYLDDITYSNFLRRVGMVSLKDCEIQRKYWFIDIEVLTTNLRERDNTPSNPKQPIISIQIYDSETQEYYILLNNEIQTIKIENISNLSIKQIDKNSYSFRNNKNKTVNIVILDNEEEMLRYFIDLFKKHKPFIISGWFSNAYDIPYLCQRMILYNLLENFKLDFENEKYSIYNGTTGKKDESKTLQDIVTNKPYFKIFSSSHQLHYFLSIPFVYFIDYKDLFEKFVNVKPESWSLHNVSLMVLGEEGGKQNHGFMNFESNFEKFLEYIYRDVELLEMMEENLKLITILNSLNELVPINTNLLLNPIKTIEGYINARAYINNVLLPYKERTHTAKTIEEDEDTFQGAFVFQPDKNIHKNVVVFDFESLYPNIMNTFNISFENIVTIAKDRILNEYGHVQYYLYTLLEKYGRDENEKKENENPMVKYVDMNQILDEKTRNKKQVFFIEKDTLIRSIIREILDLRSFYKKRYKETNDASDYIKQLNYKILANSIYGVFGSKGFAYHNTLVSASITGAGRYVISKVAEFINGKIVRFKGEEVELKVIYGDTDSLFVEFNFDKNFNVTPELLSEYAEYVKEMINSEIKNIVKDAFVNFSEEEIKERITLKMQIDKVFKKVKFFGVKKRYYGYDYENNLIYKGIDLVRSDASQYMKKFLREMFDYLIEIDDINLSYEDIKNKLLSYYYQLKNSDIKEIADSKMLLDIENYKIVPYHLRGLKLFCKIFNFDPKTFINQKLLVLPIKVKKESTYFKDALQIFNEKRKNINIVDAYLSIPYTENVDEFIKMVNEFLQTHKYISIDYLSIFDACLKRLESFGIDNIIKDVITTIEIQEDVSKLTLFNLFSVDNKNDYYYDIPFT